MPETTAAADAVATATGPDYGGLDVATEELWSRRMVRSRSAAFAVALTGVDPLRLDRYLKITLAASDEAAQLLEQMEFLFRTLTTTISTSSERCVLSVRGPVLWAETITARANALGNDDVFVCGTSSRSFDTIENRILVAALENIAGAAKALRNDDVEHGLSEEICSKALAAAQEAARWRNGPRLVDVPSRRLSAREVARMNGSRRLSRMASVMAFRDRQADALNACDVVAMSDEWTRRLHAFTVGVMADLGTEMRVPGKLTCFEGGIWAGPVSFRHPAAGGSAPAGLAIRGVPLLPPKSMVAGAPWADLLPANGIGINSKRDVTRIVGRLGDTAVG